MGLGPSKGFKIFDKITSIFVFIFSLIAIIAFWIFVKRGDVYDNWYPLVGHFVAAHGAFIGIILYEYLKITGKSFRDLFKKKK